MKKGLNDYSEQQFSMMVKKGFHDDYRSFAETIALIHSELSEALEEDRKGNIPKRNEEIADVFLRLFDWCGSMDLDIENEIEKKMAINEKRPRKHGKLY